MDEFKKLHILGILRDITKSQLPHILQASLDGGLQTIEIALNTQSALELISLARSKFDHKITIGAGTALTKQMAIDAINAGATFLIAPNLNEEVAVFCRSRKIAYIPGALTPHEIYNAWKASLTMVKVFPASVFGPKYFKDLRGPYKDIQLMATGGVTLENARDYFSCGTNAIAVSSSIYRKDWIEAGNWKKIKETIQSFVAIL